MMEARKKEYIRTRTEKRKAEHEAIVELAKTDEEATNQLEMGPSDERLCGTDRGSH